MWMSVPQIPVFLTRISTSSDPITGTGTSRSQRPGSSFAFTSAFITKPSSVRSDQSECLAGILEGVDGEGDVGFAERCRHLGADPGLALRHHRKKEARDIDAALIQR